MCGSRVCVMHTVFGIRNALAVAAWWQRLYCIVVIMRGVVPMWYIVHCRNAEGRSGSVGAG